MAQSHELPKSILGGSNRNSNTSGLPTFTHIPKLKIIHSKFQLLEVKGSILVFPGNVGLGLYWTFILTHNNSICVTYNMCAQSIFSCTCLVFTFHFGHFTVSSSLLHMKIFSLLGFYLKLFSNTIFVLFLETVWWAERPSSSWADFASYFSRSRAS